jgi:hypothetical protein
MRNFVIAIIASTILTLPAFAQNNQGGNNNQGDSVHRNVNLLRVSGH